MKRLNIASSLILALASSAIAVDGIGGSGSTGDTSGTSSSSYTNGQAVPAGDTAGSTTSQTTQTYLSNDYTMTYYHPGFPIKDANVMVMHNYPHIDEKRAVYLYTLTGSSINSSYTHPSLDLKNKNYLFFIPKGTLSMIFQGTREYSDGFYEGFFSFNKLPTTSDFAQPNNFIYDIMQYDSTNSEQPYEAELSYENLIRQQKVFKQRTNDAWSLILTTDNDNDLDNEGYLFYTSRFIAASANLTDLTDFTWLSGMQWAQTVTMDKNFIDTNYGNGCPDDPDDLCEFENYWNQLDYNTEVDNCFNPGIYGPSNHLEGLDIPFDCRAISYSVSGAGFKPFDENYVPPSTSSTSSSSSSVASCGTDGMGSPIPCASSSSSISGTNYDFHDGMTVQKSAANSLTVTYNEKTAEVSFEDNGVRLDYNGNQAFLGSSSTQKTLSLLNGWNLKGAHEDINDMSVFENSCIDVVWTFKDGAWNKYIPSVSPYNNGNRSDGDLKSLAQQDGYWVKSNSNDCSIELQ